MKKLLKHWQRNLLIFLFLILLGLFGWTWHYCHQPGRFPIQHVQIGGQLNFVSPQTVENTVSPYVSNGFFNVPVSDIRAQLMTLPGVAQAVVIREFPNTVKISITEVTPVALFHHDSLIDTHGQMITPELLNNTQALPEFRGPISQMPLMVSQYELFSKLLFQDQLSIRLLNLDDMGQWQMVLNTGLFIQCGNQKVLERLSRFIQAYPTLLIQNPKQTLVSADLRYPEGFALRWA